MNVTNWRFIKSDGNEIHHFVFDFVFMYQAVDKYIEELQEMIKTAVDLRDWKLNVQYYDKDHDRWFNVFEWTQPFNGQWIITNTRTGETRTRN